MAAALVFVGCVQPGALETSSTPVDLATFVSAGNATGAWVLLRGGEIARPPPGVFPPSAYACVIVCTPHEELTCEPGSCEIIPFSIEGAPATVLVRAQSVRNYTVVPSLHILDASGETVAEGKRTDWLSVATLPYAKPGAYEVEVMAVSGSGAFDLAIVVAREPAQPEGETRELLPDLATIRPSDLQVVSPGTWFVEPVGAALAPGCGPDEALEGLARRCLRFSNGVANVGEGPLEVKLAPQDAALSFAAQGRFVQLIRSTDGSVREEVVGPASFHATHGHYHYTGLATYELYEYDEATKTRGELVREGRKAGFCFYDTAMVDLARADVGEQGYDGRGCFDPASSTEGSSWYTGVSPGFTDFYGWYLPDQYVEIAGVPDGTYELVSIADGYGTLVESDTSNNAGTAIFRLAGDDVHVLWTTGV